MFTNRSIHFLSDEDLAEICKHTESQCLHEKVFPKRELSYLIPLCDKVMSVVEEPNRPFGKSTDFILHIVVNAVINGCKMGRESVPLLLKHCDFLNTVVKDIPSEELQHSFKNRNRWGPFVKQVRRFKQNQ